ncbi:MAG: CPBP family intramembrane metalloprotease [Thiomicrorhabdus sp.]|jgi:hypothetical protein|nr:CPBP family intramembrane metalloprotease [Thiomicrorhabdus sp.]
MMKCSESGSEVDTVTVQQSTKSEHLHQLALCLVTFKFSDCLLLFAVGATQLALPAIFKESRLEGVAREVEAVIVKMIQEAVAGWTPLGLFRATVYCAALFGVFHILRIFFEGTPVTVGMEIVHATAVGFAYGAFRWRTKNIWPLILIHALYNFLLSLGRGNISFGEAG